jgi:selenocysteine-specific elongation factor
MKHVIVGTAGHIDHGKTSLVKTLTGVDADRLKEEKRRGITIDIGFAHLELSDFRLGFVDVPGHERFIKNMLAGAHGLDLVMLVIAADEGVMPQTREHFDICRLLRIPAGFVALTKCDMVEPDWLELVTGEVAEFLRGSFLDGAPVVPVSAKTGAGVAAVKAALRAAASSAREKNAGRPPRLPVDRVFTIRGFGTVVTGTLISGRFQTGDEVDILPGGRRSRIRGIEAHNAAADRAEAGQRTALNLSGVEVHELHRGQAVVPAGRFAETSMLDVELELLPSAEKPLPDRARIRLHHGASETMARVALLGAADGATALAPGERRFAQLRLESPILALPTDRFIIRSYSPQLTIGGGMALDVHPERHRRNESGLIPFLTRLVEGTPQRVAAFIERAKATGVTPVDLARLTGESDERLASEIDTLCKRGEVVVIESVKPTRIVWTKHFGIVKETLKSFLHNYHRREPMRRGVSREEVRESLGAMTPTEVFRAAVEALHAEKRIVAEGDLLRLASFRPEAAGAAAELKTKLENVFQSAGLQGLSMTEAFEKLTVSETQGKPVFFLLLNEKRLTRVGDLVMHAEAIERLTADVRALKGSVAAIDVGFFKERFGLSRKYAIPLLEYLDAARITRRTGNVREIL